MTFEGILLDIDGTLVMSNDIQAKAWVEAFAAFGREISFEQVRPLIGMGGAQSIPLMTPGLSGEKGEGKQISDRRKELVLTKFASELKPTNGARQLVAKLQQEGLQIVIASSATQHELDVLLKAAQADDLLKDAPKTITNDADASKPDLGIIESALEKGGFQPEQVVMMGDAPYDIESAGKADVQTIVFRTGGFSDDQLRDAIVIYEDPADLVAKYSESPLATKTLNLTNS
jgi:HAD superfamily hydrolase (TIGR01509 family)